MENNNFNNIPISIIVKTKNNIISDIYILSIIYYTKHWEIEKTNKDLKKLYETFKKLLPYFPFFENRIYSENEIEIFFKECNKRENIISNDIYKSFLNLDKNSVENYYVSEKINSLGPFKLCVNNFCYSKEKKIIIISGFNDDESKDPYYMYSYSYDTLFGEINGYYFNIDNDNKFNFKKLFIITNNIMERVIQLI